MAHRIIPSKKHEWKPIKHLISVLFNLTKQWWSNHPETPTCPFILVSGLIFVFGTNPLFTRMVMLQKPTANRFSEVVAVFFELQFGGFIYLPEIRAVERGDDVSADLCTRGETSRLSGFFLRVDGWAGHDVQLLRVVVASAYFHPSVLQLVHLKWTSVKKDKSTCLDTCYSDRSV